MSEGFATIRVALATALVVLPCLPCTAGPRPFQETDPAAAAERAAVAETYRRDVVPFLQEYCTDCHGGRRPRARLALDRYTAEAGPPSLVRERETWEKVLRMLLEREMPPEKEEQPGEVERGKVTRWIRSSLDTVNCNGPIDPGRVTIRRLNRAEYNNTVRDLLGLDLRPADDFPMDEVGHGFDNIGDVLSLPPLLVEKYVAAAEEMVRQALAGETTARRIFLCRPGEDGASAEECARRILRNFASRAYRRPVRDGELERLVQLALSAVEVGDSFQDAIFQDNIALALEAVLVSPHFLLRVEIDPEPDHPTVHPVSDYELASRLSYFLWSSMPDDELLRLAGEGRLQRDDVLEAQTRRMLEDPKSRALVENFASQWLQTRFLERATPDPELFPGFDDALRQDMGRETLMFFEAILREDRSILEFLEADFTFLNERLARHYGIKGVRGDQFRRVDLDGHPRGGVLTQASILTITSNPTRTSPVKRGKWILEQILGAPPPPPPPGVEELSEEQEAILSGSLRQRMEQHREDPNCAVCHRDMDQLGFAFENFDAVGKWRDFDGKFLIDPSGRLPDGGSFDGPAGLKAVLKGRQDEFSRCLAEKMLTYALGRGLEYYDRCAVDRIVDSLAGNDYKISTLILEVVKSVPFRKRRGGARILDE